MKRIFIFGSTGYIGKNLKHELSADFEIITVGRHAADINISLESNVFQPLLDEVLKDDFFIFLSAISSPDECEKNYAMAYKVNVENTISLISQLLVKDVKVLFSSSDAVFGATQELCHDDSDKKPFGKYGEMKAEVEDYFRLNEKLFIIRFSYVLGKGDKFTKMVEGFFNEEKTLDVFDGFERNVISINDVTAGIKNIIYNWDAIGVRVVNFSGNELVSRQEIVSTLEKYKYPGLKYKFTDAPDVFWKGRPKVIHTKTKYLEYILNRKLESYLQIIKE